jgi:hypothetical protein
MGRRAYVGAERFRWRTNDIEATMEILARIKSFSAAFQSSHLPREGSTPVARPRLQHRSRDFRPGERALVTFEEGRALFSEMDDEYAFGELDEPGKLNLRPLQATTALGWILGPSKAASISLDGKIRVRCPAASVREESGPSYRQAAA